MISKLDIEVVLVQKCSQLSLSMGSLSELKITRAVDAETGRWLHGDTWVRQDLLVQLQHHVGIITFLPRATTTL